MIIRLLSFSICLDTIVIILLFQLVTLPVEFNASTRGKIQLQKLKISTNKDDNGVKDMLFAAALTYVAALTSSILQILRLLLIVKKLNM